MKLANIITPTVPSGLKGYELLSNFFLKTKNKKKKLPKKNKSVYGGVGIGGGNSGCIDSGDAGGSSDGGGGE